MNHPLFVCEDEAGLRLDSLLARRFPNYSRTYFQYLIESGAVLVNGKKLKKREKPLVGDEVEICFILTPELALEPEDIPLEILYEDENLLAINKPAGLVVHPAPGHPRHTFANALLFHCKELKNNTLRPGVVHRLDKDTSGVLLGAKTAFMHEQLVSLFSNRQVKKTYLAVCLGNPGTRTINIPLGRHPKRRKEIAALETGREAISHVRTLSCQGSFSLVEVTPLTGRTHQIRVHLKEIGSPILGDPLLRVRVRKPKGKVERQLLHARHLAFEHPNDKKFIEITAPFHKDFLKWMNIFSM